MTALALAAATSLPNGAPAVERPNAPLPPSAAQVWGRKPVLPVLLAREGRTDALAAALDLDAPGLSLLLDLVAEERDVQDALLRRSNEEIDAGQFDPEAWNDEVAEAVAEAAASFERQFLGTPARRRAFGAWLSAAWEDDRRRAAEPPRRAAPAVTGPDGDRAVAALSYEVFATQYVAHTDWEIAVPDKYVKFANLGWENHAGYEGSDYTCDLDRSGGSLDAVWVGDVGPWNIEDNYWNTTSGDRPRRMWTDLPQGTPESEAAYYDDYNGGLDQYDRTVTNPAGVDLSLDVATGMGLAYLENAWITVTYNWEDGGGGGGSTDGDGDGVTPAAGDCDDGDASVHPGAVERCDAVDNDCSGAPDDVDGCRDGDGDAWTPEEGDCDDGDSGVHPGAPEEPDGRDQDCDGVVDEHTDAVDDDGDAFSEAEGDCDDYDPGIFPGAAEVADGRDQDCDGLADDGTEVFDDDGDGYSEAAGDCDDGDSEVHPTAPEQADQRDQDCDGVVDEGTELYDDDGDGFAEVEGDCDDWDPGTWPGAPEVPDGVDQDCDGVADDGTDAFDDDGDGRCEVGPCVDGGPGGDCDDSDPSAFEGATEEPDGVDDDCDGTVDETTHVYDDDGDGFCEIGPCVGGVPDGDCDDHRADVAPGTAEMVDGVDQDCDGVVDEETPVYDDDGDGFCEQGPCLAALPDGDCDDADPRAFPGNPELADGIDNDCDGRIEDYFGWGADEAGGCRTAPGAAPSGWAALAALVGAATRLRRRPRGRRATLALLLGLAGCEGVDLDAEGAARATAPSAFSTDYGPAAWVPASSCNYSNYSRSGSDVRYVIIHTVQGSYSGCISWFQNCSAEVSAHYVVAGDGRITQMVLEEDVAWHAGNWTYNLQSVGIEHEGYVSDPSDYTDELYCASALLTRDIADDHGIPLDRSHIIGHVEVPGATHTDPGVYWDWDRYMDMVIHGCDGGGGGGTDADGDGHTAGSDCNDGNASIHPGAAEVCNGVDDDCNGTVDGIDGDGDGHAGSGCGGSDCDDGNPGVHPGAAETCDSRDQDCDGIVDEGTECYDDDGDGLAEIHGDCDDADALRRPGLFEEPDGKDNDCDGEVDEHTDTRDDDGDGYSEAEGDCNDAAPSIAPGRTEVGNGLDDDCDGLADEGTSAYDDDGDGASEDQGDCDDADPTVHPGAEESPDGVDDDCDGTVDEGTDVFDDDGDGWSEASGDCDDWDPMAFPGASELPDGTDNDCDGLVDDGTDLYDDDGDGFAEVDGDCDDADPMTHPTATEAPDGVDDDCDGVVDEGTRVYDDDGDGFAEVDGDCDDGRADAFPDAPEQVNDLDEDCDGRVDNDTPVFDDDGDGFCEALTCLDGAIPGDCDDLDPRIHPRAPEAPDGIDNDCDGRVEDYLGWGAGPQGACAHAPAGPAAPVGLGLLALVALRSRRPRPVSRSPRRGPRSRRREGWIAMREHLPGVAGLARRAQRVPRDHRGPGHQDPRRARRRTAQHVRGAAAGVPQGPSRGGAHGDGERVTARRPSDGERVHRVRHRPRPSALL
ncbi:N-acetylmuramoyl-L-alanine amidase [Myxococcota bacterium]|nr:N-acetylmuramoyl-L-alanine amidase [Myxococcota bacterium]